MTEHVVVMVTSGSEEEAERIARALVEEKLAACVNVVAPIRSLYTWQGKTADERECLLIIKSRRSLFPALAKRVRDLHSYAVPEIIALPIVEGSAAYLEWLSQVTRE